MADSSPTKPSLHLITPAVALLAASYGIIEFNDRPSFAYAVGFSAALVIGIVIELLARRFAPHGIGFRLRLTTLIGLVPVAALLLYLNVRGHPELDMPGITTRGFPAPFTIDGAFHPKIIVAMNIEYFVIDVLFNIGALLLLAWLLELAFGPGYSLLKRLFKGRAA